MITLIDLTFRGVFSKINFGFIQMLNYGARETYFVSPEGLSVKSFDEIKTVISFNKYIDFIITTDKLKLNEKTIPRVFINLVRDDENIELLFYFDLKDIKKDLIDSINFLENWSNAFNDDFKFNSFMCEIDGGNGNVEERYFDNNGKSLLFYKEFGNVKY